MTRPLSTTNPSTLMLLVACSAALDPAAARAAIPERVWGSYIGEASDASGAGRVALDAAGNIYVAGYTNIAGLATPRAHKPQPGLYSSDGYLIKFDPAGERIWGTYFGGEEPDHIHDLAAFLARFAGTGTLQWATYFGGPPGLKDGHEFAGYEFAVNVATRGDDRVVLAGGTDTIQGIATPDTFTPTLEGVGLAAFVAVFTEMPADDDSSGTGATSGDMAEGTGTTDPGMDTPDTDEATITTGEVADTTIPVTSSTSDGEPAPTGDGPIASTTSADSDASDTPAQGGDSPADGCACNAGPTSSRDLLPLFGPLLLRRRRPA